MNVRVLGRCSHVPGHLDTGHLTPAILVKDLEKLDKPEVPVKIFHMKPQYLAEISSDLEARRIPCQILNGDQRFTFNA